MRYTTILLVLLLMACDRCAPAAPGSVKEQSKPAENAWSKPVNGLEGRLILKEEPPEEGMRMIGVYLELRTLNGADWPEIYYNSLNLGGVVRDRRGKALDGSPFLAGYIIPPPYWLTVPRSGTLQFHVAMFGYEVPKTGDATSAWADGPWILEADGDAPYSLSGTFQAQIQAHAYSQTRALDPQPEGGAEDFGPMQNQWHGTLELPRVEIPMAAARGFGEARK